jgi:hypothetical protein
MCIDRPQISIIIIIIITIIIDDHGSYIAVNVVTHCMKHTIDLLALPPQTLYMLLPLDVSVFALLKRALAKETDAASKVDHGRI